jgi:hypothetical protein
MKATALIRRAGLRGRMEPPEVFLRRMNRLCLAMAQATRRAGSKRERKRGLRQMKRLLGIVRAHARRHRELLDQQWARTDWTRPQAKAILRRLDTVLELLPRAQKQAHERIIGGRPVANADKILSLYDPDLRVIVRGKAGAEVEFGNYDTLLRQMLGVAQTPWGQGAKVFNHQTLRDNVALVDDALLQEINALVAAAGRPVFAKKEGAPASRAAGD